MTTGSIWPRLMAIPRTSAALFTSLLLLGQPSSAQTPPRATWNISFDQVEAAASLPDLRNSGPETFEAHLMGHPPPFGIPLPFLRLVRTDGELRATLFVYWGPQTRPDLRRTGPNVACRDAICVQPVALAEQRNWDDIVERLASGNACPPKNADVVTVCGDCPQISIKTTAYGRYREQQCENPAADSIAGELLDLMYRAARLE